MRDIGFVCLLMGYGVLSIGPSVLGAVTLDEDT